MWVYRHSSRNQIILLSNTVASPHYFDLSEERQSRHERVNRDALFNCNSCNLTNDCELLLEHIFKRQVEEPLWKLNSQLQVCQLIIRDHLSSTVMTSGRHLRDIRETSACMCPATCEPCSTCSHRIFEQTEQYLFHHFHCTLLCVSAPLYTPENYIYLQENGFVISFQSLFLFHTFEVFLLRAWYHLLWYQWCHTIKRVPGLRAAFVCSVLLFPFLPPTFWQPELLVNNRLESSTVMWRVWGRHSTLTELLTRTSTCTRCHHWCRSGS